MTFADSGRISKKKEEDMAKIEIKHNPGLTKEKLLEIFQKHFQGKYEVLSAKSMINRDFVVKKTGMSGVFVKLKQTDKATEIVYNKDCPSVLWRAIPIMRMVGKKDVMADVTSLLNTLPKP